MVNRIAPVKRSGLLLLSCLATLLVAAWPPQPPENVIREANDAFGRGDLESAESLYARAEERAPDPGLVAFNKGTALYNHGEFRRAELCFRRALGDADIPADRRARAMYNLGNCLVRQAGDTDVRQLQSAIDCYELAIRESSDEGIRSDAGHNLEVAKLLWAKARARRPAGERDPEWEFADSDRRPDDAVGQGVDHRNRVGFLDRDVGPPAVRADRDRHG